MCGGAGFEAAQARALGVEQRGGGGDRAVFEQREQFDGVREAAQQRARDGAGSLFINAPFVARLGGQRRDGGERVFEFGPRALAVRGQPRDVAAVDAAAGDEQVFARAPGQPAQLHLPRGGAVVGARLGAGERQAREAFD